MFEKQIMKSCQEYATSTMLLEWTFHKVRESFEKNQESRYWAHHETALT